MALYFYSVMQTPLGSMLAIAGVQALHVLQIVADDQVIVKVNDYQEQWGCLIPLKSNAVLDLLTQELEMYFAGGLQQFAVPVKVVGTPFQQAAWNALQKISYGKTVSYQQIAAQIGSPKAMRAVGGANGANPVMIVIPCHRVIQADGKLGGYAGGIEHKKWLLEHELKIALTGGS